LSTTLRSWSSIGVSKYLISIIIMFVGLTQTPLLIFYTVNSHPIVCLGLPNLFQEVNAIIIMIVWYLIPSLAMFTFGLLTIHHIQQSALRDAGKKSYQSSI
jgi:hypothetical protein